MRISITGRKVNLRDNFKQLATKKLSRFERIFDEDAEANVVVTVERNRQTVEITIKQRGMIYRAEATEMEMNDALDRVISALGRQIRKIRPSWTSESILRLWINTLPTTTTTRKSRRSTPWPG